MKWKVSSNIIGDKRMYIVLRLIDESQPMHPGNVEYASGYMKSAESAQEVADKLNEEANYD